MAVLHFMATDAGIVIFKIVYASNKHFNKHLSDDWQLMCLQHFDVQQSSKLHLKIRFLNHITLTASVRKISRLILSGGVMVVYWTESYGTHKRTVCGQNAECLASQYRALNQRASKRQMNMKGSTETPGLLEVSMLMSHRNFIQFSLFVLGNIF